MLERVYVDRLRDYLEERHEPADVDAAVARFGAALRSRLDEDVLRRELGTGRALRVLQEGMEMPTQAYCENCDAIQPVSTEPLLHEDATGRFRGGDMVCEVCGFIICTLYGPAAP